MASSKVHLAPTAVLVLVSLCYFTPLTLMSANTYSAIMVLLLGIFMDGDHLSIRRIKKILRGEKGPVPGWVNWMHTWSALLTVCCVTLFFGFYLSFTSYLFHILIDGGDIDNARQSGAAPVPEFLHKYYPERLKYETGIII